MVEQALKKHGYNISLAAAGARPDPRLALPADGEAWALRAIAGFEGDRCKRGRPCLDGMVRSCGLLWRVTLLCWRPCCSATSFAGRRAWAPPGCWPAASASGRCASFGAISSAPMSSSPASSRRFGSAIFRKASPTAPTGSGFAEIGEALDEGIRQAARRAASADRRQPLLRSRARRRADAACSPSTPKAGSSSPTRRRGACSSVIRASGSRISAIMATPSQPLLGEQMRRPAAAAAADARRASADGDGQRRLGPSARRHGPGRRGPADPGRAQRDRDRRPERPGPGPHPRDHELDDPGDLARPQRGRPDGGGRHGTTIRASPTPGPRSRRSRGAPTGSCISSKATARSAATPEVRRRHLRSPALGPRARIPVPRQRRRPGRSPSRSSVDPDRLTLDADPDLMCQVLINLLRNAAEAARGHGDTPRRLAVLRLGGGRPDPDRGRGQRRRAFPRLCARTSSFPSSRPRRKGTGVGLSLARQVVLAHRGSIGLGGSSDSGGALFRILL